MSEINIGSNYIAIASTRLGENIIMHDNQSITSIDRQRHNDQNLPFKSQTIGNEMKVDFRRNADDEIRMNPLRTIRIPHPHNTRTRKVI